MYDDIEYDYLAPASAADRTLEPARPVDGQLDLADELAVVEGTPKARSSDPPTAHAAAAAVKIKATSAKARLLLVHYDDHVKWGADHAGWTDEEAAGKAGLSLTSEYATRCSELRKVDPPLLVETGHEREGAAGVGRMVSRITDAGIAYVQEHAWR